MEDVVYYTVLFDLYGELLTEKQQAYFKDYYFNNLSLKEIADTFRVSRNAIHNQLKEVKDKLNYYENTLHLALKNQKLEEISSKLDDEISNEIKKVIEL